MCDPNDITVEAMIAWKRNSNFDNINIAKIGFIAFPHRILSTSYFTVKCAIFWVNWL
jgi:hypothetical protein